MKPKLVKSISFYFIEVAFFVLAYVGGLYKHVLFNQTLSDVAKLPVPSYITSLLMILIMSLPLLLVMYVINKFYLKISVKLFFVMHLIFVATIWGTLESLIYLF